MSTTSRLRRHIFAFFCDTRNFSRWQPFCSVMEREFEVGVLKQHRAGARDTSPQKRENQVIVHFTFGALFGARGAVAWVPGCGHRGSEVLRMASCDGSAGEIVHERQRLMMCGLHAVNALLQTDHGPRASYEDLAAIAGAAAPPCVCATRW